MRTDRIKQRLNVNTSKLSLNDDTFMKVNLENTSRLLPYDEINRTVNLGDRFDLERKRSSFYRIIGSINSTATNALFNLTDSQNGNLYTWSVFNTIDFLDTSYPRDNDLLDKTDLNYAKAIQQLLLERDGWFGYFDPDITKSALCEFFDMEPKRQRFSFVNDTNPYHGVFDGINFVKNWELTITYPKTMDKTHYLVNSNINGNPVNGLLIVDVKQVIVSNRSMLAFGVPCKHNLKVGDTIILTGTTAAYDGEWVVSRTGLENGTMKDNYFILDIQTVVPIGPNTRMIRVSAGFNSEYYFRIFKKIKTRIADVIETDDYETYKLGFSENIYSDPLSQFVFNEDIDVGGLTDNLGRPLSELYLTAIKTDSNALFTNVSSGIDSPYIENLNDSNTTAEAYLLNVPIINKIHNGGTLPFPSHIALENSVTINDNNSVVGNDYYYGDLVEYNINTLKEVVLADVNHRFNTRDRQSTPPVLNAISLVTNSGVTTNTTAITLGPRQEGYFYKAHHLIRIRQFSEYIETGVLGLDEIPNYSTNMGDGRYNWRDLLDIGFNETDNNALDYPFTNGSHHMYQNFMFHIRRQDPFNLWNLFHTDYPADPIGQSITNKFNVNTTDNDC
jgi:hypothetical protein